MESRFFMLNAGCINRLFKCLKFFHYQSKVHFLNCTSNVPAVNTALLWQLITYFKLIVSWYCALVGRYVSRRKWLPTCLCKHRKSRSWKPKTHFLFWEYFHCFTGSCKTHCSPFASPVESRHTNHCVEHEVVLSKEIAFQSFCPGFIVLDC
jgi:hypothetical protein